MQDLKASDTRIILLHMTR